MRLLSSIIIAFFLQPIVFADRVPASIRVEWENANVFAKKCNITELVIVDDNIGSVLNGLLKAQGYKPITWVTGSGHRRLAGLRKLLRIKDERELCYVNRWYKRDARRRRLRDGSSTKGLTTGLAKACNGGLKSLSKKENNGLSDYCKSCLGGATCSATI